MKKEDSTTNIKRYLQPSRRANLESLSTAPRGSTVTLHIYLRLLSIPGRHLSASSNRISSTLDINKTRKLFYRVGLEHNIGRKSRNKKTRKYWRTKKRIYTTCQEADDIVWRNRDLNLEFDVRTFEARRSYI